MLASISIRRYTLGDIPRLYEAVVESKEELGRWLPWCHPGYAYDDAQSWIESQLVATAGKVEYPFVITDAGQRFLGGCGLNLVDRPNLRANVGYWVRQSASRRGVATSAVKLLVNWAFAETEFVRLEVVAAVENRASQRVAEKAGAEHEGVLRSRLQLHCRLHDAVIYSFIRRPMP